MTAFGGFVNMDTTVTGQSIGAIDETNLDKGKSLLAGANNASQACGQPIPGCSQLAASNTNAVAKISQFLDGGKQVIQALKTAGQQSMVDYQLHDGNGAAGIQQAAGLSPFGGK